MSPIDKTSCQGEDSQEHSSQVWISPSNNFVSPTKKGTFWQKNTEETLQKRAEQNSNLVTRTETSDIIGGSVGRKKHNISRGMDSERMATVEPPPENVGH